MSATAPALPRRAGERDRRAGARDRLRSVVRGRPADPALGPPGAARRSSPWPRRSACGT